MNMPGIESASMNLKTFKTTPAGTESPEPSPTRSVSPLTLTSSSSSKGRRSVSSMKDLMPLALSPSLSTFGRRSSSQSVTVDDGGVERLDDYLPELLARDLEMSSGVFASKDMTSGTPSIASIPEEKGRARASKTLLYSPYLAASARVQVLDSIEERKSVVSFLDHHDPSLVEHHSDSASITSHGSSEGAAPPSFRHRGSVVTTATSVGSTHCNNRISSLAERDACECSWMDADSDGDERENELFQDYNAGSLYPRPPTPPGPGAGIRVRAAVRRANMPITWSRSSRTLHRKSHSVNGDTSTPASQRCSLGPPLKLPQRSSSVASLRAPPIMTYAESSLSQLLGTRTHGSSMKTVSTQALGIDTSSSNTLFTHHRSRDMSAGRSRIRDLSPTSYGYLDSDDEAMYSPTTKRADKENSVFIRPPSPPQPLRSVQSWLNSSLQPCAWVSHGEDNARVVPLPPDVVENLRVSVACFPETMLLTSSLTMETIRSYAKKVRQPSMDCSSIMNGEILLPESPRRSLWRKVVPHRRGSQSSELRPSPIPYSSRHGHGSVPGSSAFADMPKPWTPLKNVFGCCSDYICDALYAHIVAYNYISALVARNPVSHSVRGRRSTTSARDWQPQDDIPKKAASLLGLSAGSDISASMGRCSQRMGSPLSDWARDGTMRQRDTGPTAQDSALRVIQGGLLRCISRLLATAKLMAENGTGEDGVVEVETDETDMLFMRSLCEIVRMAEDAA
ncbi:hypothetical protein E4U55_004222 [Claviceps digitariae]|nr:hypothetical protein E4U55_004222 [Claviceps digitariae]